MTIEEYIEIYMQKHSKSAYMSGAPASLKHGAELAIGFGIWVAQNFYTRSDFMWYDENGVMSGNDDALFQIYLNQLNNK